MKSSKLSNHIFHISVLGNGQDDGYREVGWYFTDETEYLHGPYPTELIAYDQFCEYCRQLDASARHDDQVDAFAYTMGYVKKPVKYRLIDMSAWKMFLVLAGIAGVILLYLYGWALAYIWY